MRKVFLLSVITLMCFTSCNKYLDIVPDHIAKMEDLFTTKTDALDALAKIYSYLPVLDNIHETPYLLGDEYVCVMNEYDNDGAALIAQRVMRDLQSSGNPLMGIWSGTGGGKHYYVAMRHCDLVMEYVDLVFDMNEQEKKEFKAQVKFLKAYFAFTLIQQYGPIVLPQYLTTDETDPEKLFPARVTIDESFDYVIKLMREAIPDLTSKSLISDLGKVDQVAAKAILARVYVFRASPFYSDNGDLYGSFRNTDGTLFFPQGDNREEIKKKWEDARDALDDALAACNQNGIRLYKYSKPKVYDFDSTFYSTDRAKCQAYYDRRFVIADPWNTELIWGRSEFFNYRPSNNDVLSNACNIILPKGYEGQGMTEAGLATSAGNFMSASYQMLERYYTKNGLPIDEDKTVVLSKMMALDSINPGDITECREHLGLLQPGHKIVSLYKNREIRFYADLIISGGYSRTHRYKIETSMFQDTPGGKSASANQENYFCTGIGIQKMVHPESAAGHYFTQVRFPYPFIRLADLILMRAEAQNELQDTPDNEVWKYVDSIRVRAGIPKLDEVWSDPEKARNLNKHTSKPGMREIILQERAIELAFEGIHYWDMVRYKKAITEFTKPIRGWNPGAAKPADFFGQQPRVVQFRRFSRLSYLWPISIAEININSNLVNNPGWE